MGRITVSGPAAAASGGTSSSSSQSPSLMHGAPIAGVYQYNSLPSNGTDSTVNTQVAYTLPAGVQLRSVRLRFVNHSSGPTGEVTAANSIGVRASVATSATGPWFQCAVGDRTDISIPIDGQRDTDPIALSVTSPGKLYVRTYLFVNSGFGYTWPAQTPVGSGAVNMAWTALGEVDGADLTASATAITGTYNRPYAPFAVLADYIPRTTPVVAVVGDSIAAGQGDTTYGGFILRALSGVIPYMRVAVSGSRVQHIIDPNPGRRRIIGTTGCNVAISNFGTNDIYTDARTLAQVQADCLALWSTLKDRGMQVFQTTLLPQSSTTDSYATLANQTTRTGNTTRVSFNNWIRAGAPINASTKVAVAVGTSGALLAGQTGHPLRAYFETADIAESARDSGKWIVTGAANYATTDGTHPTAAVHALLSAAINTATITAAVA